MVKYNLITLSGQRYALCLRDQLTRSGLQEKWEACCGSPGGRSGGLCQVVEVELKAASNSQLV